MRPIAYCCTWLLAGLCFTTSQAEPLTPGPPIRDGRHIMAKRVASWQALKRRNVVMQERDYSCGAAALATILRYHIGDQVTEDQILAKLDNLLTDEEIEDRIENGLALSDIRRAAVSAGYQSVVAKLTLEKLLEAKTPLIVGITEDDFKHFVVYRGTDFRWVYLADPIRGNIRQPINQFAREWQKNLALAVAKPGQKVKTTSPLSVSDDDLLLGRTNKQLILTTPSRTAENQP